VTSLQALIFLEEILIEVVILVIVLIEVRTVAIDIPTVVLIFNLVHPALILTGVILTGMDSLAALVHTGTVILIEIHDPDLAPATSN